MNGEYPFSTTPGGTPGLFPKAYKDYPGGVEYFEFYSPAITTLYSQVWWSPLEPIKLPEEMVKKYAGKAAAIVGWEIDQVRKTDKGDVSVPVSASYNHHYTAQIIGGSARFKKVMLDGPHDPRVEALRQRSHGMVAIDQPHYLVEEGEESALGVPQWQWFSSANGGEYRKTFHGFTPGYVMIVDSPTEVQMTPMQIDTWNRDKMNISTNGPVRFVPGPLPRASLAPPDATYSGLLECPLTTRITKEVESQYTVLNAGKCREGIATAGECFKAAATTLGMDHTFINQTVRDPNMPSGCLASAEPSDLSLVRVYYNEFNSKAMCSRNVPSVAGSASSLVQLKINVNATSAIITISGPAAVWFGVGLGALNMGDAPWTVVVEGNGAVSEWKLGDHVMGTRLETSVQILSQTVTAGVRRVVLQRPLEGRHHTFSLAPGIVPFINAVGSGPSFSYHKDQALSSLTLLPPGEGACVCLDPKPFGEASGSLVYNPVPGQKGEMGNGSSGFGANKCKKWPASVLLNQSNPTCDIRAYAGGQWACKHMWSLLDADQDIPWPDQPLVMYHKYRMWVQPYNESYHQQVRLGSQETTSGWLIGSPWEYDVPKCREGIPGCSKENGTWVHTIVGGMLGTNHSLSAMNFHCHAPTCLSMELWACPSGTPVGECDPSNGQLVCREEPVYGGSGSPALSGTRFDEAGYIAIPDCMWGPKEYGLEPPFNLTGLTLQLIKRSNATYGHYGEMAGGQPWQL